MSNDFIPAIAFVALGLAIATWIAIYRGVVRALRERHPERAAKIFGSPTRRKNGMDRFFGLIAFLFQGGAARGLGDRSLRVQLLALKFCTALVVLCFLAMMFSPISIKMR